MSAQTYCAVMSECVICRQSKLPFFLKSVNCKYTVRSLIMGLLLCGPICVCVCVCVFLKKSVFLITCAKRTSCLQFAAAKRFSTLLYDNDTPDKATDNLWKKIIFVYGCYL